MNNLARQSILSTTPHQGPKSQVEMDKSDSSAGVPVLAVRQQPAAQPFYESIWQCIDQIDEQLKSKEIELADPEWSQKFSPVRYEETLRLDFEIKFLKGRATLKYFHVNIYRLESGRYELNTYCL